MFFRVNPKSTLFQHEISTLIQGWQTDVISTLKYCYLFNVTRKILIFQASLYKNKIVFIVNPKSTSFQRWILSMNQRWQIVIESTWISGWPTSRCYLNIYQYWINVEYLLGICFMNLSFPYFIWNFSKNFPVQSVFRKLI